MSLSIHTQSIIRDGSREIVGSETTVMVFGSRIDDAALDSDIDLLIQLQTSISQRGRKALQLVTRLQVHLGD